jgi:TRAP-type C4-dicarboxylate transport system permease small subunit
MTGFVQGHIRRVWTVIGGSTVTTSPPAATPGAHPAGPVAEERSDLAEAGRMLLRTVLPTAVLLCLALAVYGGTGHDLTIVLQDRFPDDSEYSGLFTIMFSSALMVCAGVAIGAIVVSRAWSHFTDDDGATSPAQTAGLAVAVLCVWLGFDDMMMVHDAILPGMGIPETAALAVYALIGVVLVVWAFRPLRRERLGLTFLTALALLGGSLVGDEAEDFFETRIPPLATFLGHAEDVVKFLAYVALCHLCVLLARRILARTLQVATERAAREAVERAGARRRVTATVLPSRSEDRTQPIPAAALRAPEHPVVP